MAGPVTGIHGAFQQPGRWGRNESGNYEIWVIEGTRQEVRNAAAFYANIPGISYEVTESFGKWHLEIRFPWNADGLVNPSTDLIETWEFFAQHTEKDLLEAQDNVGLVHTISDQQKEIIRTKILNPPDGSTSSPFTVLDDFAHTKPGGVAIPGNAQNALTIYQLMQAGMKSYLMEAPMLRRTIITSNQYALGYSLFNVRKLLSTAYIANHEGLPNTLLFNVTNYVGADVSTDSKLAYGWFKMFPTIQQIALLKWQIVQEWAYGWWAKDVYGQPL
jgi:hypothetical protein